MPRTASFGIRLSEETLRLLEQEAQKRGVSKNELVVAAVQEFLSAARDLQAARQVAAQHADDAVGARLAIVEGSIRSTEERIQLLREEVRRLEEELLALEGQPGLAPLERARLRREKREQLEDLRAALSEEEKVLAERRRQRQELLEERQRIFESVYVPALEQWLCSYGERVAKTLADFLQDWLEALKPVRDTDAALSPAVRAVRYVALTILEAIAAADVEEPVKLWARAQLSGLTSWSWSKALKLALQDMPARRVPQEVPVADGDY